MGQPAISKYFKTKQDRRTMSINKFKTKHRWTKITKKTRKYCKPFLFFFENNKFSFPFSNTAQQQKPKLQTYPNSGSTFSFSGTSPEINVAICWLSNYPLPPATSSLPQSPIPFSSPLPPHHVCYEHKTCLIHGVKIRPIQLTCRKYAALQYKAGKCMRTSLKRLLIMYTSCFISQCRRTGNVL